MFTQEFFIVFPEGDVQKITGPLSINSVVDINGGILAPPLSGSRMIAFRVLKMKTDENKGGNETYHFLQPLSAGDPLEYT